jgi:multiple sugar transport system ATP-binding protein
VQQAGTPAEIYQRPQNIFVATFIGSPPMNLMKVDVTDEPSGPVFQANGLKIPVPASIAGAIAGRNGSQVLLGVRPEEIKLQTPLSSVGAVGTVELSELLGSELLLETRVGETRVTVTRIDPGARFSAGESVGLQFAGSNLHVFDPVSGMSLTAGRLGAPTQTALH